MPYKVISMMFLAILILACLCNVIKADANDDDYLYLDETIQKDSLKGCETSSFQACLQSNPEMLRACKVCGLTNDKGSKAVINGKTVVPPNRYPWMVGIIANHKVGNKIVCGGAIISDKYILTAAHCVKTKSSDISIFFLTSNSSLIPGSAIQRIIPHPDYNEKPNLHDIALIQLKEKITCSTYRNPVCLPSTNTRLSVGTDLVVAGWGAIKKPINGSIIYHDTLLQGNIRVASSTRCMQRFPHIWNETYMKCMESTETNQAPCFGDSGGSMFLPLKDKFYTMGITSFGNSKCDLSDLTVFASVSAEMEWIKKVSGVEPANFFSS